MLDLCCDRAYSEAEFHLLLFICPEHFVGFGESEQVSGKGSLIRAMYEF